ncbi:MAG: LuxR C-terminal-related transcriptional regulator [bacterium]|nr:LuxR C-terminal-related transcriptional regulator [bacterium]
MTAIQVGIVSTNAIMRAGLQKMISDSGSRIEVAGIFESFADVDRFAQTRSVRALIADETMQTANLIKELKRLVEVHPGLAIILILQRPTASLSQRLMTVGVRALLHKDDDLEHTLNHTILTAVSGSATVSQHFSRFFDSDQSSPAGINQRDLDILQLLTEGLEPKEIAASLGVKYHVVNRAINKLLQTYEVQSVVQLGQMAHQIVKVRKKLE